MKIVRLVSHQGDSFEFHVDLLARHCRHLTPFLHPLLEQQAECLVPFSELSSGVFELHVLSTESLAFAHDLVELLDGSPTPSAFVRSFYRRLKGDYQGAFIALEFLGCETLLQEHLLRMIPYRQPSEDASSFTFAYYLGSGSQVFGVTDYWTLNFDHFPQGHWALAFRNYALRLFAEPEFQSGRPHAVRAVSKDGSSYYKVIDDDWIVPGWRDAVSRLKHGKPSTLFD